MNDNVHQHEDATSYRRLDDGTFGVRGPEEVLQEGAQVEVTKKDGSVRTETIGARVTRYDDTKMALHRIVRQPGEETPVALPDGEVRWTKSQNDGWVLAGSADVLVPGATVDVKTKDGKAASVEVGKILEGETSVYENAVLALPVRTDRPATEPTFARGREDEDEWILKAPVGLCKEGGTVEVKTRSDKMMKALVGTMLRKDEGAEFWSFEFVDADGDKKKGEAPPASSEDSGGGGEFTED